MSGLFTLPHASEIEIKPEFRDDKSYLMRAVEQCGTGFKASGREVGCGRLITGAISGAGDIFFPAALRKEAMINKNKDTLIKVRDLLGLSSTDAKIRINFPIPQSVCKVTTMRRTLFFIKHLASTSHTGIPISIRASRFYCYTNSTLPTPTWRLQELGNSHFLEFTGRPGRGKREPGGTERSESNNKSALCALGDSSKGISTPRFADTDLPNDPQTVASCSGKCRSLWCHKMPVSVRREQSCSRQINTRSSYMLQSLPAPMLTASRTAHHS